MVKTAIIDADYIRFAAASVGEKRTVVVTHKATKRQMVFNSRTEFYGHWAKKNGGWLAERNKGRTSPFTPDEFEYEDVQTVVDDISHVLHSCKLMFNNAAKAAGCDRKVGYLGKGQSFRRELSTILEYKANRDGLLRPLLMPEVTEYMVKRLGCQVVENIEADDICVIDAYGKSNHIVIAVDKDAYGQPVNVFNPNRPEEGVIDCNQYGKLWLDSKNEVRGYGRAFLYYQIASQDTSDNYAANSATTKKWGSKSAYKALVGATDDKEALLALKDVYLSLYPERFKFIGWRGEEMDIDWLYVLNENWHMARMLRTMDELENKIHITDVFDKVGVSYET